ncbi:unnamed protein product [Cochlearia groenlandica]
MKRKMKQEMVVSDFFSRSIRITRTCRNRIPVDYTYDEYNKKIVDVVEETRETYGDYEEGREKQIASKGSEGNNKPTETTTIIKRKQGRGGRRLTRNSTLLV